MKLILSLLLCLFGLDNLHAKELISTQCEPLIESSAPIEEVSYSQGLLWSISKKGKEKGYLFGTIHVSDKEVTTLPELVDKALRDSDQFVMEALPDLEQMMSFSKTMFFSDGQLLSNFVDAPVYEETKRILSAYHLGSDAEVSPRILAVYKFSFRFKRPSSCCSPSHHSTQTSNAIG